MIDSWYVEISPWKQIIQIVSWHSDLVKNKNNERRIAKTLNVFSSSSNRAGGGQSRWWAFFFLERGCRQEFPVVFPGSEKFFSNLCMSILSNDGFLNLLSFSLEVLSTDHLPDQTQVGHK